MKIELRKFLYADLEVAENRMNYERVAQQKYGGAKSWGKSEISQRYIELYRAQYLDAQHTNYWQQFNNFYPDLTRTQNVTRYGAKAEEYKPINLDDYL